MTTRVTTSPKKQDQLLNEIFQENISDFLRFVYSDCDEIFDLDRGIAFLNKELMSIIPIRERKKGIPVSDLLIQVFLKDGQRKWILIHTEMESEEQKDLAFDLFQYYIRLLGRFRVHAETIMVFAGNKEQPCLDEYRNAYIHYRFKTFHIFDLSQDQLGAMDNIFAHAAMSYQKAISQGNTAHTLITDEQFSLTSTLLDYNHGKDRIGSFLNFMKSFLFLNDSQTSRILEKEITQLSDSGAS